MALRVFNAICATANVAPYFSGYDIGSDWTAVLSDDVSTEVQPFGVVFSIHICYKDFVYMSRNISNYFQRPSLAGK